MTPKALSRKQRKENYKHFVYGVIVGSFTAIPTIVYLVTEIIN